MTTEAMREAAHEMYLALEAVEPLLLEEWQSIHDGYLIRYIKDPQFGQLSDEGKEAIAPIDAALATIRAALAQAGRA